MGSGVDAGLCRKMATEIRSDLEASPDAREYVMTWGAASAIADQLTAAADIAERTLTEARVREVVIEAVHAQQVGVRDADRQLADRVAKDLAGAAVGTVQSASARLDPKDAALIERAFDHYVRTMALPKADRADIARLREFCANAIAARTAKELAGSVVERRYVDDGNGGCASCGQPYTYHEAITGSEPTRFRCRPAAPLTEQLKPATASIGPEDAAIIDAALGAYSSDYNDAPHERIAAIRAQLSGPAPQDGGS